MVTEPCLHSSNEAFAYLTEVRKIVRWLNICDGNMEEGSMRCDANISVRKRGAKEFGVKVEVKNMNSIRNVQRAIEHEMMRQIDIIEAGGTINQETRSFNAADGTTSLLRSKEDAQDYRYFPEPDLPPVVITDDHIQRIHSTMPPLPKELLHKYLKEFNLSEYDANVLTSEKETALYYERIISKTKNYKLC